MDLSQWLVVSTLQGLTNLICDIDDEQLKRVPQQGPLIIVTNHTNVLEIPIIYTHLQPRAVTGFVASVRWERAWSRWLLEVCKAIPVRRGEPDVEAIRRGMAMLSSSYFVIVMPEGTRSGDGRLMRAHAGVVLLALYSQTAILPIAFYGGENYKENMRHLKRTQFHIAVGKSFNIQSKERTVARLQRQEILDEIMCQIALLLPEGNRGYYAEQCSNPPQHLVFQ